MTGGLLCRRKAHSVAMVAWKAELSHWLGRVVSLDPGLASRRLGRHRDTVEVVPQEVARPFF